VNRLPKGIATAKEWFVARVDAGDLLGLVGILFAYDGATSVFGQGVARLGLGLALIGVYVLREARVALRPGGRL
jgi:hypothetical protein